MRYVYDYRKLCQADVGPWLDYTQAALRIANEYGKDGWRWVNPAVTPRACAVLVFELAAPR